MSLLEAASTGSIDVKTLPKKIQRAVKLFKQYQACLSKEYAERERSEEPIPLPNLVGRSLFIHSAVSEQLGGKANALVKKAHLKRVLDVSLADVFLVADVTALPAVVQWAAMLGGGLACDRTYIATNGHEGRSMAFQAKHQTPRIAWFSPKFAKAHAALLVVMIHKTCPPVGQWTWKATKEEFLEVAARVARSRPAEVLAFVHASEVSEPDMRT